jgi:hypothetical protein
MQSKEKTSLKEKFVVFGVPISKIKISLSLFICFQLFQLHWKVELETCQRVFSEKGENLAKTILLKWKNGCCK